MKRVSEELLSLIIGEEVSMVDYDKAKYNHLIYKVKDVSGFQELNLDTLGRYCKKLCLNHGYELSSRLDLVTKATSILWKGFEECLVTDANEEVEAIIINTEFMAEKEKLLK